MCVGDIAMSAKRGTECPITDENKCSCKASMSIDVLSKIATLQGVQWRGTSRRKSLVACRSVKTRSALNDAKYGKVVQGRRGCPATSIISEAAMGDTRVCTKCARGDPAASTTDATHVASINYISEQRGKQKERGFHAAMRDTKRNQL